jgi:RNA polymerase sigma-70 factor (ECF subfamily)
VEPSLASPDAQAALAGRVARGEASAEEDFARLYRPRVLAMMRARLRDRETARELANDVLMAALVALRQGRLREGEKLSGFVHGIARNVANSHLRGVYARPPEAPLEESHAVVEPYEELERAQRVARVRREMEGLDPLDRLILTRTLVDGLKPGEIAPATGLSPEAVRARKSRAIKRLVEGLRERSRS